MNIRPIVPWALMGVMLACVACGAHRRAQTAVRSPGPPIAFEVRQSPGVTAGSPIYGKPEECNGLDDNGDGVIDEGCGYQGGDIQITLSWNTGADIDLYVTDPGGETIFYNQDHRTTSTGGEMDHDGRGDCRPEQDHPRIENVFWKAAPPRGEYKIELNYFGPCGDIVETETTLAMSIGGSPAGVYHYLLKPEERVKVITITFK